MTKREAVSKHRDGDAWRVVTYGPDADAWYISAPLTYRAACNAVREMRRRWNTRTQRYTL